MFRSHTLLSVSCAALCCLVFTTFLRKLDLVSNSQHVQMGKSHLPKQLSNLKPSFNHYRNVLKKKKKKRISFLSISLSVTLLEVVMKFLLV